MISVRMDPFKKNKVLLVEGIRAARMTISALGGRASSVGAKGMA